VLASWARPASGLERRAAGNREVAVSPGTPAVARFPLEHGGNRVVKRQDTSLPGSLGDWVKRDGEGGRREGWGYPPDAARSSRWLPPTHPPPWCFHVCDHSPGGAFARLFSEASLSLRPTTETSEEKSEGRGHPIQQKRATQRRPTPQGSCPTWRGDILTDAGCRFFSGDLDRRRPLLSLVSCPPCPSAKPNHCRSGRWTRAKL
jgi:hypothetical protein